MKVDLPQPDGPMTAVTLCKAMGIEMLVSARLSPNHAERSDARIFALFSASSRRAPRRRMLSIESPLIRWLPW